MSLWRCLLLMMCVFLAGTMYAQSTTIAGKITDDKGNPLEGASIMEKGTRNAVVASPTGIFTIKVKPGAFLVFSAIGFEEKAVKAVPMISVSLNTDIKSLSEVVVTGVGFAQSKKKLPISVETITADKLGTPPTSSISQALVGKVAGAQISSTDGTPGAKVNILLRGVNSLRGGTGPMILIDGIEVRATDLGSLDLNNVERIEVVEGAASSTIYGAQGANGVIQVFTKKGKVGITSIDFSSSYGSSKYLNIGNLHQAYTHAYKVDANNNVVDANGVILTVLADGTYTSTATTGVTQLNANGVKQGSLVWDYTNPNTIADKAYNANLKFYDHFAQVFKTANNFNNSISVTGGAGKTDYALTMSRSVQESDIRNNGSLTRTNFTSNIGTELFKGFKIRSVTQLVYQKNNFNPYFTAGPNALYQVTNASPFFDFNWKDANGDYANRLNASPVSVNGANPNYYTEYSFGSDITSDVIQNLQASYKVNKFIDLDAKYGINYEKEDVNQTYKNQQTNINAITRATYIGPATTPVGGGGIQNYFYNTTFQNALLNGTIHLDLQKDLHLKIPIVSTTLIGYDYRKNLYTYYSTVGYGLQGIPIYNNILTSTQAITNDFQRPFVTFGQYLNESLDIGNIAGVKGGFRSDYSSAFGAGSNAQTFYNGNAYFRVSQLGFWDRIANVIPEFKIRGGYGQAGIQPGAFDRYVTLTPLAIGSNLSFYQPSTQNNPNLKVEVSIEKEIGTDIAFNIGKHNWLSTANLTGTLWERTSKDVIFPVDAAPSTGGGGYLTNAFSLSSKGYTFILNLNVYKSKEFNWDFTANFNHQSSQIDAISTGQDVVVLSNAGYGNYVLRPGTKIGQLYGLKTFHDVNQTRQDGSLYIDKANAGKYQVVNGNLVDTATRGIQFTNENYAFGDPNPKYNMAFINNISYKGLALSFQLDWVYGSHLYNQTKEWMYRDGIHGDYGDPVSINGKLGAYQYYYFSAYADMWGSLNGARNAIKDYYYENSSFLRLRNVNLSYDIARVAKIKAIKKLQIVLTGRNLWTVTKYTGMDPEVNSGASNSGFDRGVDYVSTPNSKTYQVGINVGF